MSERPNTWELRLWDRKVSVEMPSTMMMWLSIPQSLHQELSDNPRKKLSLVTKGQTAAHFYYDEALYDDTGRATYEARWIWLLKPGDTFSLMFGETDFATWKRQEDGEYQLVWKKA